MRSLKWKCVIFLAVALAVMISATGFSEAAAKRATTSRKKTSPSRPAASQKANNSSQKKAPASVSSDDIIAEEMLKLAEALRKTSQLEKGIPTAQENKEKLAAQYDIEIEQVNAEIERLTANIELLEQKVLDLEDKRDEVLDSESSDDIRIDEELEAIENEADEIADRLFMSFDVMPEYVYPFNPKATSQIVEWIVSQDEETEEESLVLTILHNRQTQKLTRLTVPSDLTDSGDVLFKVENLPEGLQVFIPGDSSITWTVKADGRVGNKKFDNKGYFVAKINDTDDISYSDVDGDSNITEDGSKTFTSGEAFIILRKSNITIYLTEQKH